MIILTVLKTLAQYALAIFALLSLWAGVREWRQFLLREPYKPAPRWVRRLLNYLPYYLWLLFLPLCIDDLIRFVRYADGKSLFVEGFLGFCIVIGLAARYWGSEKCDTSANLPANPSR